MYLDSVRDYFNEIKEKLTDKKTYYVLLYIFISLSSKYGKNKNKKKIKNK